MDSHFPSETLTITHDPLYPSDSHKGHKHSHIPILHSSVLALAVIHTLTRTHSHALPSVLCRQWWWPVFGRLMAVCSSQPSHLITPVDWCLDGGATTPGHQSPPCHRSQMLITFIRNVNVKLRTPCAKWYVSYRLWNANRTLSYLSKRSCVICEISKTNRSNGVD